MFRCPACSAPLSAIDGRSTTKCAGCGTGFEPKHGYACLLPLGTEWSEFDSAESYVEHEAAGTVGRINRYFVPALRELGATTVLSIGCGDAADVSELNANGFDAYGFDIPYRIDSWAQNTRDDTRVFIADGRAIPVEDGSFDVAIALGVLEHVGAIGTSSALEPDWESQRIGFIRESTRILKPGGSLIVATPNGAFPVDLQHNISRARTLAAIGRRTGLSLHSPRIDFLPSYKRLRRWASVADPRLEVSALPLTGYLGLSFQHTPALRPLAGVVRASFNALDHAPPGIRQSGLNPYLVARIRVPRG
jgi:SAM-dependent methyltransferase